MTSLDMSGDSVYHVVYPKVVRTALNAHVDELLSAGWEKRDLGSLLKTLDDRLRREPVELGNPLYSLKTRNIVINVGFAGPFAVQFGIHEESKSVFVRKFILMRTKKAD
jgi:hypothetical protein